MEPNSPCFALLASTVNVYAAWLREVKSDIMKIDPQFHTVAYVFPAEPNIDD
ncbi:MAG: hypothetical protein WA364_05440 [Candidatus Nitrosopolaris sp.]